MQEIQKFTLEWQGRKRSYFVTVPARYSEFERHALVIVLHGGAANAEYAMRMSEMNPKADQENFLAVYPNGTGLYEHAVLTWNAGRCCGYAHQHHIDDTGFIRAMIRQLEKDFSIDSARIYVTGISNGAMMCYRLACELPGLFAAIAPVAGTMNCDPGQPGHPVSIIHFHGTADQHAPYLGGTGSKTVYSRVDSPVSETIRFWVKTNGCAENPETETTGKVQRETYRGGRQGVEVVLYTIKDEGHTWPGGKPGIQHGNVDPPTQAIRATDLIWEFFKAHPKPA
ncbi:MAG: hypothetical protein A2Y02_00310 [Omnitrophica bacterium GWA2_52_12]|nr:MAG: hypothetical protein A2Y02_00310 [Omnitrophica bacterium GWA2_52_12]